MSALLIRPMRTEDEAFILDTWLRGYAGSFWATKALRGLYYPTHRLVVESILRRAEMRVACSSGDESTIAGWACVEGPRIVHFVHMRPELRGNKIAKLLLADYLGKDTRCSHEAPADDKGVRRYPEGWSFDGRAMFSRYEEKVRAA